MRYLDEEKQAKEHKEKLQKVLEYLINGDNKKAQKLLHEVLVEKAKKMHENI